MRGVDMFWKPNGQTQLTATVNPDFGQVESDDLVVSFDATETFISDKRPFFTENQGLFEFTTPSDFSQLLYTRRVGGPADDGDGSGDIIGALKLNGNLGATKYGLFAADEAEEVGRTFAAIRLVRDFSTQNLGFMATNVERPFLDRTATVAGVDHNWRPNARWNVRTRLIGSEIDQSGSSEREGGATVLADYEMDHGWRQQWILMHFGDELQINDAGFLDRNSTQLRTLAVQSSIHRPAGRVALRVQGLALARDHRAQQSWATARPPVPHESREPLRDGSYEYGQINIQSAGMDDLLTRGNGFVNLPPNFNSYFEYQRPRKGNWALRDRSGSVQRRARRQSQGRLQHSDRAEVLRQRRVQHVCRRVRRIEPRTGWCGSVTISSAASTDARCISMLASTGIGQRQELRLKLQAIAINADLRQAYRVDTRGNSIETDEPVDDFNVRNLGIQLRYRYELAPLSYLYVVYGRGGFDQEPVADESSRLLRNSFSLRDDEQLLVKLSYRFEK